MSAEQRKVSVLERAKRAFLQMTTPTGFGSENGLYCSIHLVNIPPMMARVFAIHKHIYALCGGDSVLDFAAAEERLDTVYRKLHELAMCCHDNMNEVIALSQKTGKELMLGELPEFYWRLSELTATLLNAAELHTRVTRAAGSKSRSDFDLILGRLSSQGGEVPELFLSNQEVKLYHFVHDYLKANYHTMERYHIRFRSHLPKPEQERYNKAFTLFTEIYSQENNKLTATEAGS